MLEFQHVSFAYEGKKSVIHDLSCRLDRGDCVTVIGHNGAGKSTFFDLVCGRLHPQQGVIILDGKDITQWPEHKRAQIMGRLFQNPMLNTAPSLTVRENIQLSRLRTRVPALRSQTLSQDFYKQVQKMLPYDLYNHLDQPTWSLSGGQRQLLSFALLVQTKPALLLLDEPTAALDTVAATSLLQEVMKIKDIPILLITHDSQIAQYVGNRLWQFDAGQIKAAYGPEKRELPVHKFMQELDLSGLSCTYFK